MSYYYLISGLPDLTPDGAPPKMDFEETLDTIERNLEESDRELFRYLVYPNDNRNFLSFLFEEYKDFPTSPFIQPAILPRETIRGYRRQKGSLPQYMDEFVTEYEDQFPTMTLTAMEERLTEMFHEEVKSLTEPFITDYFSFEKKLQEAIAAYNLSMFDFLPQPPTSDDNVFYQLGKHKSLPASLQREYPFLEEMGEVFEDFKPDNLERFVDRIKWDYLSSLTGFFERQHVYAYTLKLLLVWRWRRLEGEREQPHFNELSYKIKTSVRSPKIPLI